MIPFLESGGGPKVANSHGPAGLGGRGMGQQAPCWTVAHPVPHLPAPLLLLKPCAWER